MFDSQCEVDPDRVTTDLLAALERTRVRRIVIGSIAELRVPHGFLQR